jgi:hypothetical protein
MIFKISQDSLKENLVFFMKRAGYFCLGQTDNENELSFVRSIRAENYPRFHVIARQDKGKEIVFNLHLDQKKTVYKNSKAHSADYDGPLLDNEAERIKGMV